MCLTASCTHKAEGRVQQDPLLPDARGQKPAVRIALSLTRVVTAKALRLLEASANSAAPIGACTLSR